jgi:virginiamycin A acetyltransferase
MNQIDPSVKLYKDSIVLNSTLKPYVSIGDFSKVQNSVLNENVRIDRSNHIDTSSFGRFSYTGRNTVILHSEVGAFCSISWNTSIGGATHDYRRVTQHSFLYNQDGLRPDSEKAKYERFNEQVKIGNDVWIAAGVVITRGVVIGDGAVIGANSVVAKNVPPYAIVAGAPSKIIKYRFEKNIIELLLELKWWNWPEEKIKENYTFLAEQPDNKKLQELFRNDSI